MALQITDANFEELVNSGKPMVLDFWAEWCGPCRMVSPIIDELATEYEGRVTIGKMNVDENDDVVGQFGIRNIPTVLFFKDGKMVDKVVGATAKDKFVEKIEAMLKYRGIRSVTFNSQFLIPLSICRLPGGPGRRLISKPAACIPLRTSPFAQ